MRTLAAASHPVGSDEVQGQWFLDNGHDAFARHGDSYAARTPAAVKRWAGQHIPVPPNEGHWWIQMERGTWQDASFTDPGYGYVVDVEWVRDDGYEVIGTATVEHGMPTIVWEDWS